MQLRTSNGYGKVDVTNGSAVVKGTDELADWTQVTPGYSWFSLVGDEGMPFLIQTKTAPGASASGFWEITLAANYEGPTLSEAEYIIHKDFTLNFNLALFAPGDVERAKIINRTFEIIDLLLGGGILPGIAEETFDGVNLTNGQTDPVVFTFEFPKLTLKYVPTIVIENIVDAEPELIQWMITGKTLENFTVSLVNFPPTANYVMRAKA